MVNSNTAKCTGKHFEMSLYGRVRSKNFCLTIHNHPITRRHVEPWLFKPFRQHESVLLVGPLSLTTTALT